MDTLSYSLHTLLTPEGIRQLVMQGGYIALFIIVFSETGLLVGFFLPGDSLLVTAGLLVATHVVDMHIITLNLILMLAAILGDATGYFIGKTTGPRLYSRPDSRLFKREHLIRTRAFYEKHGGKTIIFARFIPIVRTFAPVVAGAAEMGYGRFATYNIIGGILWVFGMTMAGFSLARIFPDIEHYLHYVIAVVILLSILPPAIEWLRNRKQRGSDEPLRKPSA